MEREKYIIQNNVQKVFNRKVVFQREGCTSVNKIWKSKLLLDWVRKNPYYSIQGLTMIPRPFWDTHTFWIEDSLKRFGLGHWPKKLFFVIFVRLICVDIWPASLRSSEFYEMSRKEYIWPTCHLFTN